MKNQLIAVDDRLKYKKIKVQIYSELKMKYTWNCQEIIKISTLMNKTAFQVKSCEFANLLIYAEQKLTNK